MAENTEATPPEDGELMLRTLTMPADANPSGDIFGGWLMGQMDIAGALLAWKRADGRVATVAVDSMTMKQPVYVGDVLCCYCSILNVGTTSIRIKVNAYVLRRNHPPRIKVTEGVFTFVAVDEHGNKRAVPPAVEQISV